MNKKLVFGLLTILFIAAISQVLQSGNYIYELINGGTEVEITDYPQSETGALVIPAMIDSKSVTAIGDNAFYSCSGLTSIDLPISLTSIGIGTFYNCNSLELLELPHSVTEVDRYAFYNCSSLTNLILSTKMPELKQYALYNCSSLESLTIPSSVVSSLLPFSFKEPYAKTKLNHWSGFSRPFLFL